MPSVGMADAYGSGEDTDTRANRLMDYLVHTANLLYLASYLMRDLIRLRLLTVVAASCLIPYFYLQPKPLTAAICWNLFFIALNVGWIIRLVRKQALKQAGVREASAWNVSTDDRPRTLAFSVNRMGL